MAAQSSRCVKRGRGPQPRSPSCSSVKPGGRTCCSSKDLDVTSSSCFCSLWPSFFWWVQELGFHGFIFHCLGCSLLCWSGWGETWAAVAPSLWFSLAHQYLFSCGFLYVLVFWVGQCWFTTIKFCFYCEASFYLQLLTSVIVFDAIGWSCSRGRNTDDRRQPCRARAALQRLRWWLGYVSGVIKLSDSRATNLNPPVEPSHLLIALNNNLIISNCSSCSPPLEMESDHAAQQHTRADLLVLVENTAPCRSANFCGKGTTTTTQMILLSIEDYVALHTANYLKDDASLSEGQTSDAAAFNQRVIGQNIHLYTKTQ